MDVQPITTRQTDSGTRTSEGALVKAMGGDWAEVVHRTDKRGRRRVVRMVYEVVAFQALRDQLKCKEIWVVGADKWRNPDEDLRQDF
jgi:hypothetical protein